MEILTQEDKQNENIPFVAKSSTVNIAGKTTVDTKNHRKRRAAIVEHFHQATRFNEVYWQEKTKGPNYLN
jgi:hypothetical protein